MKKYEVFGVVRKALATKYYLRPNDAYNVGLYSIYDFELNVMNPPFSSDDFSALNVFVRACIENSNLKISLHKVGVFRTSSDHELDIFVGHFISDDEFHRYSIDSDEIHQIIAENGGIEE